MNISPDGLTVRFKTEPEDLFESEKSGEKPNTARILDAFEADQIRRKPPEKIIIQHQQEIFLRTITHIHLNYNVLGKVIAIFSWTNEKHHHPLPNETEHDPKAHTMSLEDPEPSLCVQAINIDLSLRKRLDSCRGEKTYDEVISTLLARYESPSHQRTMPEDWRVEDQVAENAPATEEPALEHGFVSVILSKQMFNALQKLYPGRSINFAVQELHQLYRNKHAEERGPLHD